jgi:hypothetical protein
MRRRFVAAMFLVLSATGVAQKARDAVAADPDHHRVMIENDHVRVFEARASAGDTSPTHSHPPFVFISLDTARGKLTLPDGKSVILDTYPGQAMWFAEGAEHSWQLLAGQLNVIAVEIKSAAQGMKPSAVVRKPNDSVTVDPDVHHVLFENDQVRVFEARAAKGRKSPMHSHPASLVVPLKRARMKGASTAGNTAVLDFTPGVPLWFANGMEHSWEVLAGELQVIVVEVKSAHMPSTAPPKKRAT